MAFLCFTDIQVAHILLTLRFRFGLWYFVHLAKIQFNPKYLCEYYFFFCVSKFDTIMRLSRRFKPFEFITRWNWDGVFWRCVHNEINKMIFQIKNGNLPKLAEIDGFLRFNRNVEKSCQIRNSHSRESESEIFALCFELLMFDLKNVRKHSESFIFTGMGLRPS